jgi:hypothetical protein
MSQGELKDRPGLAVRVTYESGRLSEQHLADAYELVVPPRCRIVVSTGRHHLISRWQGMRHLEGARAC